MERLFGEETKYPVALKIMSVLDSVDCFLLKFEDGEKRSNFFYFLSNGEMEEMLQFYGILGKSGLISRDVILYRKSNDTLAASGLKIFS